MAGNAPADWAGVDAYVAQTLLGPDPALEAALAGNAAEGLPPIDVSAAQGRFLGLTAKAMGARRILEVGTLGGYSTICLARALPEGGSLVSLEIDPRHADVARANVARAGLAGKVEIRTGPALATLGAMRQSGEGPFDLTFIDADKASNADYVAMALAMSRVGSVIIVDNVVREGRVLDGGSKDAAVRGTRRLYEAVAAEPRLEASVVQTVGDKGWDGFLFALVTG